MAVTEYINDNGNKFFSVYVNMRSKTMPHIRFQKRIKGIQSKSEATRKERLLVKDLTSKVALKEGHGLTWRMIINRWETFVLESSFIEKAYSPTTIKDYVSMMYRWTSSWLDRPASTLTRGDGREVLNSVTENNKSKSFQKRLKNTINMIYNWALEEKLIRGVHNSPVHGLKVTVKNDTKPEILNKNEIILLLQKAKEENSCWYPIWALALMSGMRNGELYALKWSDIDFTNKMITVQRSYNRRIKQMKSTKSDYWRNVPISKDLNHILVELKKNSTDEFVLPRLHLWKMGQQSKCLRIFCDSIGITSVRFHTLRACFATQLIGNGVEPIKVMKIAGWKDLKTMARYLRLAGIDERGATESLGFLSSK